MTDIPPRADQAGAIHRQTRKIIDEATRAANAQSSRLVERARRILADRKRRELYFDPMLFSNPAWDILLTLYVAGAEGRSIGVVELSAASSLPQSVALRWAAYLTQEDMAVETAHPLDEGQKQIQLAAWTQTAMTAYLNQHD